MIVHLNGKLLPANEATISPFDRGFVFGDGIYEGLRSFRLPNHRCHVVGIARHIERMAGGLRDAGIEWDPRRLTVLTSELLEANGLGDAFVYWQVTRGTPPPGMPVRSRLPGEGFRPTVFGYCAAQPGLEEFREPAAKSAITVEDMRWSLGHLKSIALMGNVLTTFQAARAGCDDAIMVRGGLVGEATATNVILMTGAGELVTPSLNSISILAGVTRAILLETVPDLRERPVRESELANASEIMTTGSSTMVASITTLNSRPVGDGTPGPQAGRLLASLVGAIRGGA